MKRLTLLTAFFLGSLAPAFAADTLTITVSCADCTVPGTLTKVYTFTKADMNLFEAYTVANFPNTCSPDPCTPPAVTVGTAVPLWMGSLRDGIVGQVLSWQKGAAITTAVGGITPIAPN